MIITKIESYKDLEAWQEGHKLVLIVYGVTKSFPDEETFGLVSQMRRAAISVTSNIAEGFGLGSTKEKIRFYDVARGSLIELDNQTTVSLDVGYLQKSDFDKMESQIVTVHKLINGMRRYVRKQ